jgi:hypothetical protein
LQWSGGVRIGGLLAVVYIPRRGYRAYAVKVVIIVSGIVGGILG